MSRTSSPPPGFRIWALLLHSTLIQATTFLLRPAGTYQALSIDVPVSVPHVDAKLLDPRSTWADAAAYDAQAKKLVEMFAANFAQYVPYIDDEVKAAAIG